MIEIMDFQKIVDGQVVLDIPFLSVESGELVAISGPLESGKEVLWELLTGQARPSAGKIRVAESDPFAEKESFSRRVGVLFAEDALYKNRSPLGNLSLSCRLYGLPKARAREVLEQIGLADQANANLAKLPSSLLRRLAFGRAILHHPQVLLLYEPFNRCDGDTIALLQRLIRKLAESGVAVLILSGDPSHLESLCDPVYQLARGQLSQRTPSGEEGLSPTPFKIPVRLEDKVVLINPGEIYYIEAESGHTCLKTAEARLATQFTLNELEERLSRSGFFRAHRSYLVNLQHIKEIIPYTRSSFSLRLSDPDNTVIPLSKTAAGELRELFGY